MAVVINWPLVNSYAYSVAKKKMVAAHEMGHAFGLAHAPAHPEWLMHPYDNVRTALVPASNDRSGVNALY